MAQRRRSIAIALMLLPCAARADEFDTHIDLSKWQLSWGGYVHGAYRWIQEPQNYNLAGRNNGFQLEQARLGLNVQYSDFLVARISIEGASEDRVLQQFPGGQIVARLRDAYITYAPLRALRVSFGQMVTPWDLDSMRSDADLPFVSRAVPVEGVQPTEGHALLGMGTERSLGLAVHSDYIPVAKVFSARYEVLIGNGNGENQLLNDNNKPAVFARAELAYWGDKGVPEPVIGPMRAVTDLHRLPIVSVGGAFQYNPRTAGNPPNLIDESDLGGACDLVFAMYGIDLEAGFLYIRTSHDTLSQIPDLERYGWWAHLRYTLPKIPVEITPGYRIADYEPRAHVATAAPMDPMSAQLDYNLGLLYHTFGVTVRPTRYLPLHIALDYTITGERGPNVLNNDRFEADAVMVF